MQSNQLSATQLMSSFLAGANSDIAQKIGHLQFSLELQTQHNNFQQSGSQQPASAEQSLPPQNSAAPADTTPSQHQSGTSQTQSNNSQQSASAEQSHSPQNSSAPADTTPSQHQSGTSQTQSNNSQQPASAEQSHSSQSSTAPADATSSQHQSGTSQTLSIKGQKKTNLKKQPSHHESATQTERQLVFNNPLLLESIINHLSLSASARDACKAAEDDQGRISLKALYDILNKPGSSETTPSKQDQVSSQAVQQLLASLSQTTAGSPTVTLNLKVKPKGSYNLAEFRQLLQNIVSQIQKQDSKPSAAPAAKSASTVDPSDGSGISGGASSTSHFEKIPDNSSPPVPTALAEAVDESSSPKHTQSPHPTSSPAQAAATNSSQVAATNSRQAAAANSGKAPQPAVKQQGIADQAKQVSPTSANPASSKSNNASSQAQTVKPPHADSAPAPPSTAPARTDETASQIAKQAASLSSQPTADQSNNVSLSQLSSADGTVLVSLQNSSGSDKSGGKQPASQATADSATGISAETPQVTKANLDQFSNNSFGQGKESRGGHDFSSVTPGGKTVNPALGGFSQVAQNELQQPGAFSSGSNPAQAGASLSMQDSAWPQNLAQQFQGLHSQGGTQLTLELNPKDLGHLTLHIETQQNQVHAFIATDNEQARSLLMQNSEALRSSLQAQGLVLGQISVDVRSNSNGGQPTSQQKGRSRKVSKNVQVSKIGSRQTVASQTLYQARHPNQIINLFT